MLAPDGSTLSGDALRFTRLLALSFSLSLAAESASAGEVSVLAGFQLNDEFIVTDDVTIDPPPEEPGQPGASIGVDNGGSAAVALDFNIGSDPTDRLGVFYSTHATDIDANAGLSDSGIRVSHLHFTGTKLYDMDGWSGFAVAGLGATLLEPDDASLESSTEFSMQVGGGALVPITKNLLLRFDARWMPTFTGTGVAGICKGGCVIAVDSDLYHQFQLNAGIALRF